MVAKRHHFVPKCYLESFSVRNAKKKKSNLYAFDAVDRKVFRPAPDNVALQTDFNTIDLEGHEPDAFENAMASVESDIGPALVRIVATKSLKNEEDRTLLLNLIGLLHIRNPRQRERFRGFRDRVAKMVLDVAWSSPPVENQIRTYWWCSPPRIGRQRICPARSTARENGASFSNDRCVRAPL
jgi:hypothetical protein